MEKKLFIDSKNGGNGDIWMRLTSFYSVAALLPTIKIHILIPQFLRPLANHSFGDRLTILDDEREKIQLKYSTLGMRDLISGFAKGYKYILPYQRSVIKDKKAHQFKDTINTGLFNIASYMGLVQLPNWKWITSYQGFLDVIGINIYKKIQYEEYVRQLTSDYEIIYTRLQSNIPISPELNIPEDLKENILVFPTGTSRQFVPVWWAQQHLSNACFAFFSKDQAAADFENAGLKTIKFYREPGDIITLSRNAAWTISTDSFPSHLLQSSVKNCTITITEVLKSRIISPAFKGTVADSQVSCHPCLHLDRKNHPVCAAGYVECINWKNSSYTQNIINSIALAK